MIEARSRPLFLELDLASTQGCALLKSVADRYGPEIVHSARLASSMFLLRSPWAPGLRFVGAETTTRIESEYGTGQLPISLSGSGEQLEDAFVSCVGEGIDRLAPIERVGDVMATASLPEIADRVWPAAIPAIEQAFVDRALPSDTPLAWVAAKIAKLTGDSSAANEILLPADWCLRRAKEETRLAPLSALSVGVAAGPTSDWAASRAILELIERDAASLWWMGGRRGKAIPLEEPGTADIVRLLAGLRQQATDRVSWLLDITTDIGIPAVVALSSDKDGRQLAYGMASRLSMAQAMRAAVLELCQTELAILLAGIKRTEIGEASLSPLDRSHLERGASIDANRCALLHPVGIWRPTSETENGAELPRILNALRSAGVEVALLDLTRPEFASPVMRAVAPALQPMPSSFVTARLRSAMAEFGSGVPHTGDIPLIL